jgi:hypothetical protein
VIPHRQNFSLGHWQLAQLTSLIQKALYGRISLLPTGTPAVQIPLNHSAPAKSGQNIPKNRWPDNSS